MKRKALLLSIVALAAACGGSEHANLQDNVPNDLADAEPNEHGDADQDDAGRREPGERGDAEPVGHDDAAFSDADNDVTTGRTDGVVSQHSEVSECGGFDERAASLREVDHYCDAEVLRWSYSPEQRLLLLVNTRVVLNCCGVHSFEVVYESASDVYTATETDSPPGEGERCRCSCPFDFRTEIVDVDAGSIDLVLKRDVTDLGSVADAWSGTIDLAGGSGLVVLNDQPLDHNCRD